MFLSILVRVSFHYGSRVAAYDDRDSDTGPLETIRIKQLEGLIESTTQRLEKSSHAVKLKERGQGLRQRLHEVGAKREPIIMVVGKK